MGGIIDPSFDRPDPALAGDLVEARFGMSTDLVNTYDSESSSALDALATMNFDIPLENIDLGFDQLDPPTIGGIPSPSVVDPYEDPARAVNFPDLNALSGLLNLVDVTLDPTTIPVLEAISPSVNIPDAPDDPIPDVPSDSPTVVDKDLPTPPSYALPLEPVLEDTPLPNVPDIGTIAFEGQMPTVELVAPEPVFAYQDQSYQSDLADAIKTKLYNDVVYGGTGLDSTIEQDIWDRALSRLNIELNKTYQQTLNNFAVWNHDMPDGILAGALQEVLFDADRNRLDISRDISYKQAELAQKNTHFAITSGLVYEKQMMDFINQINNRAFEAAKYRLQAVVDIFGIKVSMYRAQLEGYIAAGRIFESKIRAELSKVEIYRAQMEGAKIHGDLQEQKVRIYSEKIKSINTLINLYTAQLEGVRVQVAVDEAKIKSFNSQVEAAVARINAVAIKYNLYQAQIAGEESKVNLYGKQVDAFGTKVQATKVESDINLAEMQALIEQNKDKYELLKSAIDKYAADTQYELGKSDTSARVYTAKVGGYEAEVGRENAYLKSKVDNYRAQITEIATEAELAIKEIDVNLKAALAAKELQVEALKAAAGFQSQKVASALTSVSASAQIGFNASLNDSYSISNNNNTSSIISHSTDYKYIYSYNY